MAKLEDFMSESQDVIKTSQDRQSNISKIKAVGRKRRAWLKVKEEKANNDEKSDLSICSINQIDQSDLSIRFIDPFHGRGLKGVYRPLSIFLADLRGNPLQLTRLLFALIKEEDNDYQTGKVRLRELTQLLDISKGSARTALRFLLKNGLIKRVDFKPGQLGWSKYRLKKSLYEEIKKAIQKGSIDPFEISTYLDFSKGSNSSSSNNNNITTTLDPFEWNDIDISPLEFIGLTRKHLLQIKKNIDPSLAQESIRHFSYALRYNPKIKKYSNPLAAFISVLKRGEPWIEPNYRTPKEIAQSLLIEQKKAERERLKKLEEDAYQLALGEWQESMTNEQIEEIALSKKGGMDLVPQHVKISMYFREKIWPDRKKEYDEAL